MKLTSMKPLLPKLFILFLLSLSFSGNLSAVHTAPIANQSTQIDVFSGTVLDHNEQVKPDPRKKRRKKKKGSLSSQLLKWLIGTSVGSVLSFILAIAAIFIAATTEFLLVIIFFYLFWILALILGIASIVLLIMYFIKRAEEND